MKKKFYERAKRIVASLLITAMVFSFIPINHNVASAETVANYDAAKAVNYAKVHYDDGGTVLEPGREDCTQFVRECFEAGGVPKDENRIGYNDGKPYGYNVDDYMYYLVITDMQRCMTLKLKNKNGQIHSGM